MPRQNRILLGAGWTTFAAVLSPLGVYFAQRANWVPLVAVLFVQLVALGVGITILARARRAD